MDLGDDRGRARLTLIRVGRELTVDRFAPERREVRKKIGESRPPFRGREHGTVVLVQWRFVTGDRQQGATDVVNVSDEQTMTVGDLK